MQVVMAASEVAPFAKVGGLGDVLGALPRALAQLGASVSVVVPLYRCVFQNLNGQPLEPLPLSVRVPIASRHVYGRIMRSKLPRSDVPVYFVDCPEYFDRPEVYGENGRDYPDSAERFIFFSRAALELWAALGLDPDIIHVHDWQTALIPVYVKEQLRPERNLFRKAGLVLTIHNLAYQGRFWHWDMLLTGLPWELFTWQKLEFEGHLNFLKGGIVYADAITTVSRTYAQEILTPEYGHGLDGVLRAFRDRLWGIVNGVDYDVWNPATDPHLPANYDIETVVEGKAKCKAHLQRELGLEEREVPLVAQIGRLDPQKGWDLIEELADDLMRREVQYVALGTGQRRFEQWLEEFAARYPGRAAVRIAFDEALAHRIEAGADIFLMPSRFEPCGLNQLYSLRYGTVPVVHKVGGLADTVVDVNEETLAEGNATGFVFDRYRADACLAALDRALAAYRDRTLWWRIVRTGMAQDWSWRRSAREYLEVYSQVRQRTGEEAVA